MYELPELVVCPRCSVSRYWLRAASHLILLQSSDGWEGSAPVLPELHDHLRAHSGLGRHVDINGHGDVEIGFFQR